MIGQPYAAPPSGHTALAWLRRPRRQRSVALSGPARREHRLRASAGFSGRWLDGTALLRETGIAGSGAIRVRGNAQLNPWKVCHGFIRAAADRGALIFEQSMVTRIRAARDHVTVSTA